MSRACSVSTRRVYGKARVCRLWGVARSTHYARQAAARRPVAMARAGTRFEVLEPVHQRIREHFGELEAGVACALARRAKRRWVVPGSREAGLFT